MGRFSAGRLTPQDAAALDKLYSDVEAIKRMSASGPLAITWNSGRPQISSPALAQRQALLGQIISNNGANPPVYKVQRMTAERKPISTGSTKFVTVMTVYKPQVIYTQVLDTGLSIPLPNNAIVELLSIPDQSGWWWAIQTPSITNEPVQLTSTFNGTSGYSWQLLTLDTSSASYVLSNPAITGNQLVMVNDNEDLGPGTDVIMSPDPTNKGWWMGEVADCCQGGPTTLSFVTDVCPIIISGIQVGSVVEFTPVTFPVGVTVGTPYCTTDDTTCCSPPGLCVPECPEPGVPLTLYASFSGFADAGGIPWSQLNGQVLVLTEDTAGETPYNWQGCFNYEPGPPGLFTLNLNCLFASSGLDFGLICNPPSTLVASLGVSTNPSYATNICTVSTGASSTTCNPLCAVFTVTLCVGLDKYTCTCATGTSSTGTITVTASPSGTCGTPPTTYNCNVATGECFPVFDGSGQYASSAACTAACGKGSYSWNCVLGGCVQVGGTGGRYSTLAACQSGCTGGNSGCDMPPSSVTGTISNWTSSPIGCCTDPVTVSGIQTSGNSWTFTLCSATNFSLTYISGVGWKLLDGITPIGTLVSGTCTGNDVDVVFQNVYVTIAGCTVSFDITFTSP
jgi:hypothetical protein